MDGVEEQDAQSPPPSLVPRIHVILTRDCLHTNPLVPDSESYNSGMYDSHLWLPEYHGKDSFEMTPYNTMVKQFWDDPLQCHGKNSFGMTLTMSW